MRFLDSILLSLLGVLNSLPAYAIYRGIVIPNKAVPQVVLLRSKSAFDISTCTGTLLRSNAILTAAHCVVNKKQSSSEFANFYRVEILTGSGEKVLANAHTIILHRNYLDNTSLNKFNKDLGKMERELLAQHFASSHDIAIILTKEKIGKALGIKKYPLLKTFGKLSELENKIGIVVGYGVHDDEDLLNSIRSTKVNARTRIFPHDSPNIELRLYENGKELKSTEQNGESLKRALESLPTYSLNQPSTFKTILRASEAQLNSEFGGVSAGDSGGPLFAEDGGLIGINSSGVEPRTIDPKYRLEFYDVHTKEAESVLATGTHLNLNSPAARQFLEAVGKCQDNKLFMINRSSIEICPSVD